MTPLTLPAASPVSRVQQAFGARVAALPEACRRAVLVAALGGMAELAEVSRAIAAAGGSLTDLAAAERAGLLRVTPAGVIFSHPLVRAAVLAGSDVAERMAGHQALAGVLDGDRRAWHLAALATAPTSRSPPSWTPPRSGQATGAAAPPCPPPTNEPPGCRPTRRPRAAAGPGRRGGDRRRAAAPGRGPGRAGRAAGDRSGAGRCAGRGAGAVGVRGRTARRCGRLPAGGGRTARPGGPGQRAGDGARGPSRCSG